MNYCTARFQCKTAYGDKSCEFYEGGWDGDCIYYHKDSRRSCINANAREAATNKLIDEMRDIGDG